MFIFNCNKRVVLSVLLDFSYSQECEQVTHFAALKCLQVGTRHKFEDDCRY